jgi:hypothetical protein
MNTGDNWFHFLDQAIGRINSTWNPGIKSLKNGTCIQKVVDFLVINEYIYKLT